MGMGGPALSADPRSRNGEANLLSNDVHTQASQASPTSIARRRLLTTLLIYCIRPLDPGS